MDRNGGVVALTVVGVLVAGGAAAALNTVVLHGSTQASVGSAEEFLSAGQPPLDPTPSATPSTTTEPTATPTVNVDQAAASDAPSSSPPHAVTTSGGRVSTPRATRTTTRNDTIARVSTPRPSPSPTEHHGGSHGDGGKSASPSASPTSGFGPGSNGSDD